jgi:hypothetical protein
MARLRNRIRKADYFSDGELLRWHRDKRTTYSALWALAEDSGCLEDDCFEWKMSIWPSPLDSDITVETLEQWRDELIEAGKLVPYHVDGKRYLFLRSFHKHEHPTNPQGPDLPLPEWVRADTTQGKGKDGKRWARCQYTLYTDRMPPRPGVCTDEGETQTSVCADDSQTQKAVCADRMPPSVQTENNGRERSPALNGTKRNDTNLRALRACCAKSGDSAPPAGGKPSKISSPKDAEWQARADAVFEETAFPSDYLRLGELLAAENKTKKAALSRVVRELYEPLLELERETSREAMRAGLRAAIAKPAPNATYVKKAAASHAVRPQAVAVTSRTMDRSAFGEDFYTDGGEP